jgi:hypothetical protein
MALLVDKLRPRNLDALSYHPELSDRLRSLVRDLIPPHGQLSQDIFNRRKAETSLIY